MRNQSSVRRNAYFFDIFTDFWWKVGEALWPFDGDGLSVFFDFMLLEVITDISFVDRPEAFFDASALFSDTLFRLFSEVSDTFFDAWAFSKL